ncbi:hypothetical protein A3A05_03580 [Candidatus Nomurabacteria bacterium RIFCSPLOWO2_01_FULL_41_12]|uniref:Uncharacterized protein n=1 Tax=Candidatus Nomurabacteria bacterium RIFCSPLOWO2_01_FULL_41_12 TaxID=1801774 RepID=A0A1F6WUY4_9BACT|nr:MAG: hypothetical protein A2732_02255 [Candidatus Nomurabacteria bacterium RIFCSPHIGHO2_01_FULL_40_10]OGI85678.1 MAG: hypothetical protein A3A05_03580 [Candidatus Nomurabacteria bacterium RIFCSPLOWO2_01_FULL_41_12]
MWSHKQEREDIQRRAKAASTQALTPATAVGDGVTDSPTKGVTRLASRDESSTFGGDDPSAVPEGKRSER